MRPIVTLAACVAAILAASVDLPAQEGGFACPADRVQRPGRTDRRDSLASLAVDSIRAEVRRAAMDAAAGAGAPSLEGLMMVDEPSRNRFRVRTHRLDLPPRARAAVEAAAAATRSRYPGRRRPYSLTIRFEPGDSAATAESGEDAVECRPELVNRDGMTRLFQAWIDRNMSEAPERRTGRFVAQARALVTRDGEVVFVELHRSSGWRLFDDAVPTLAAAMRFDVARVGGKPVDVWVQLPLTITVPQEPRRPITRTRPVP